MSEIKQSLDRRGWIDAATDALQENGINAVRVEPLAKQLGITKGSFYWHFKNRQELLSAILTQWEDRSIAAAIAAVSQTGMNHAHQLRQLFHNTVSDYGALALEIAIRDWARTDPAARISVLAVDARRSVYMEDVFQKLGHNEISAKARAALFYGFIVGEGMIVRDEEPEEQLQRVERCLEILLEGIAHAT